MFRIANTSDKYMHDYYYKKLMPDSAPEYVKSTLELFGVDTLAIKIKLETSNTTISMEHNPDEPIKSSISIVNPVELDAANPIIKYSRPENHLFNVVDAAISYIIRLIPSCRVIISGMQFGTVYNDQMRHGLIRLLGAQKIQVDSDPHIIFNINHPAKWFEDEVYQMVSSSINEFKMGEIHVYDYLMGMGKRRRVANLVSDQFACALYGINYMRRLSHKMSLVSYDRYLRLLSLPGTEIRRKNFSLNDEDYEFTGINENMLDSFYFIYVASNSYKNGMLKLLQSYVLSFDIVRARQLTDIIADMQKRELPISSQKQFGHLQSNFQSIGAESFVNLALMNLLSPFYRVKINVRTAHTETDMAMFDLVSNLILLYLFPSIARQNLHILAYNIISILYNLQIGEVTRFIQAIGFARGYSVPKLITDDEYFNEKRMPYLFDKTIRITAYPILSRIRALVEPHGELVELRDMNDATYPFFSNTRKVWMPWKKQSRSEGYVTNDFSVKFRTTINIVKDVIKIYDQMVSKSRQDKSGTQAMLLNFHLYIDEFSQFLHHEFYDLYIFAARHFSYLYCDFNSSEDVFNPIDVRFGLISCDRDSELPWAPFKEVHNIDWQFGLSAVLSIVGILRPITDGNKTDRIKVTYPNPLEQFIIFDKVMKGALEAVEPFVVTHYLLQEKTDPIANLLYKLIHNAGIRESYLAILHKALEGMNVPEDLLRFMYSEISYRNRLIMRLPKIVLVDRMSEVIAQEDLYDVPNILNRTLAIGDEFIEKEIEVVQTLVMSNDSLILKLGKGITIQKTECNRISSKNQPNDWEHEVRQITHENHPLLTNMYIEGKNTIVYLDRENNKYYADFDSCDFPKILWIAPTIEYVSKEYIEIIYHLINNGRWAFKFTDFYFQATVIYVNEVPMEYNMEMVKRIFNSTHLEVVDLIFMDNTGSVYNMYDKPSIINNIQLVFTTANLERDVLVRNIIGSRATSYGWMGLNKINWISGTLNNGFMPLFAEKLPKIKAGVPNFLNTFIVDNDSAVIRTYPEYEVKIPAYYFDAN